jgi:hypothetical protein
MVLRGLGVRGAAAADVSLVPSSIVPDRSKGGPVYSSSY